MLELSNEQQQRKLIKDFYKLRDKLINETNEEEKLNVVNDIIYISQILNRYFLIYDDEFGYKELELEFRDLFKKSNKIDKENLKNSSLILKENYDIYNKILLSLRSNLKQVNLKTKKLENNINKLTYKQFYDTLFDLIDDEYKNHIMLQLKQKRVHISEIICPKKSISRDGSSIKIETLNKTYNIVETNIKYSGITMLLIVHEALHSYVEMKYNFNSVFNIYREVIPIFGEFKMMDKMLNNNSFISDVIINWKELFENLKHCSKRSLNYILQNPSDRYYYIIGQLIAFYFFDIYKSDPEYCDNIVQYFCTNMNKLEPLELLKKIDLEIEELISGEIANNMVKKYKLDCLKLKS